MCYYIGLYALKFVRCFKYKTLYTKTLCISLDVTLQCPINEFLRKLEMIWLKFQELTSQSILVVSNFCCEGNTDNRHLIPTYKRISFVSQGRLVKYGFMRYFHKPLKSISNDGDFVPVYLCKSTQQIRMTFNMDSYTSSLGTKCSSVNVHPF